MADQAAVLVKGVLAELQQQGKATMAATAQHHSPHLAVVAAVLVQQAEIQMSQPEGPE